MDPGWSDFLSTLIWQLIVVVALLSFRSEFKGLLVRVARLKVGDTEVTFQGHAEDAPKAVPAPAPGAAPEVGPGGFLTKNGVTSLINQSGLADQNEGDLDLLLLFRTAKQRTWLVAGTVHLFCVLDDASTRASGRLIQWRLPHGEVSPIGTRPYKEGVGLLDLGPRKGWLYSYTLHPHADDLVAQVAQMVGRT